MGWAIAANGMTGSSQRPALPGLYWFQGMLEGETKNREVILATVVELIEVGQIFDVVSAWRRFSPFAALASSNLLADKFTHYIYLGWP